MSFKNCYIRAKKFIDDSGLDVDKNTIRGWSAILDREGASSLGRQEFLTRVRALAKEYFVDQANRDRAQFVMHTQKKLDAVKHIEKSLLVPENRKGVLGNSLASGKVVRNWVLGSSAKADYGLNRSVRDIRAQASARLETVYANGLGDLKKLAESGVIDLEILQEKAKPGSTGNANAAKIAKAWAATEQLSIKLISSVNAHFNPREEYLMRGAHSQERIAAVSFEEWFKAAEPTYLEKSFPELNHEDKILAFKSIYERIKQGVWGTILDDAESAKFKSEYLKSESWESAVHARVTTSRSLIHSSPEALYEYNKKFGQGTVHESIMSSISRAASNFAVLEKYGGDPLETVKDIVDVLAKRADSRGDFGIAKQLRDTITQKDGVDVGLVTHAVRESLGHSYAPARDTAAKVAIGTQAISRLALLANSTIRSFDDLFRSVAEVKNASGQNVAQAMGSLVTGYLKNFATPKARAAAARELGLMAHDYQIHNNYSLSHYGGALGAMGKLSDTWSTLNASRAHHETTRFVTARSVMRDLGSSAHLPWAKLNEYQKGWKQKYRIGENEWEVMRQAVSSQVASKALGGAKYITPEMIMSLPDRVFVDYLNKNGVANPTEAQIWKAKWDISSLPGEMVNQQADVASAQGTQGVNFLVTGGNSINDPGGVARRLFFEFHKAGLAMQESRARAYFNSKGTGSGLAAIAILQVGSLAMYYLGDAAISLKDGKTLPDYTSPEKILEGLIYSGLGGMTTELVFHRTYSRNRYGRAGELAKNAFGPTGSLVLDAATIATDYGAIGASKITGNPTDVKNPTGDLFKLALDRVPLNGLLATKGLWNYYLANALKEWSGPGYTTHLTQQLARQPGWQPGTNRRYFMFNPENSPKVGR